MQNRNQNLPLYHKNAKEISSHIKVIFRKFLKYEIQRVTTMMLKGNFVLFGQVFFLQMPGKKHIRISSHETRITSCGEYVNCTIMAMLFTRSIGNQLWNMMAVVSHGVTQSPQDTHLPLLPWASLGYNEPSNYTNISCHVTLMSSIFS